MPVASGECLIGQSASLQAARGVKHRALTKWSAVEKNVVQLGLHAWRLACLEAGFAAVREAAVRLAIAWEMLLDPSRSHFDFGRRRRR